MTLGAIVNARAGGVRRDPSLIARLRDVVGSDDLFVTREPGEVAPALGALRDRGCDTLLIVGGDGTVSGTLTPLLRVWPPGGAPAVALARGGTVNTIATALGSGGAPEHVAAKLLDGETKRRTLRRPSVRVRADGGEAVDGMLFVYGVGFRWLEAYYAGSSQGLPAAALLVARVAASALVRGGAARAMFRPFQVELVLEGKSVPLHPCTVIAAGGIREIGLGFRPFHSAGSDPGRIHLTFTGASPHGFLRELPALARGQPRPGGAIVHRSVREVLVRPEEPQPWSIDAELFPPARELWLGAGPGLDFVSVDSRFG